MVYTIRTPNGKTIECDNYFKANFKACATCRFWNGCRVIEAHGTQVFGVGFENGQNLGACSAQNNAWKPARSCCSRWISLK